MSSEHHEPMHKQLYQQDAEESQEVQEEPIHTQDQSLSEDPSEDSDLYAELKKWQKIAEEEKQKAEEHYNQYLRARADIENFRRRARKEVEQSLKYGVVPLIESLLPVLDNFERALEAADQNENTATLQEGIEMVYRQFLQVLSEAGLTLIEAEGKPFDPHMHNAVQQVHSEEYEPGIVVEELQAGYRFHERVIRPSMVKVSN